MNNGSKAKAGYLTTARARVLPALAGQDCAPVDLQLCFKLYAFCVDGRGEDPLRGMRVVMGAVAMLNAYLIVLPGLAF
jgi:hypothetical protein